jgi:RNA polymerase sigma factor (sigma-70 family)
MDSSLGLAVSAKSSPASLPAVSYKAETTLANNARESEVMRHWGAHLSARERTIVILMGHGLSNKRIARQLNISPETVKSHAKRIFWKLAVQSRAQAVYQASALGLIGLQ